MKKSKLYISENTRNDSNMISGYTDKGEPVVDYHSWVHPNDALSAIDIERKETINDICKWLRENGNKYITKIPTIMGSMKCIDTEKMIKELKESILQK